MEPSSLCAQEKTLHLQKDEFALSKDLTVSLWIDYRMYFGESPIIREVCGGDFVIINDDLHTTSSNANSPHTFSHPWMIRAV